ncbi:MAG: pirin family protein [Myxococcales bacterium]|nr:pirin family protein [Myxococcales bacterium]
MTAIRKVRQAFHSVPTMEGAGVRLDRVFSHAETALFDPFLLLDDFRNDDPADYLPGFPWHPHRGIETITYILEGTVEHGDSLGNKGVIGVGDVQWMTAGSGIIHQEMPKGDARGRMGGFQLWANLPAAQKMMAPRYRDVTAAQIPEAVSPSGARVRVIAGRVGDAWGPVRDVVIDPEYLDVALPPNVEWTHPTARGHTVFIYQIEGQGRFGPEAGEVRAENGTALLFDDGDQVRAATGDDAARFLLVAGKPLREPIAWYGPIVMNTDEELHVALDEFRRGTFIKHPR